VTLIKENNVKQLQSMLPLLPELNSFRLIDYLSDSEILLTVVPISQLRALSIYTLDFLLPSSDGILSIKNLAISHCSLDQVRDLFQRAPMLQYLNVQKLYDSYSSIYIDYCFSGDYAIYLKQLTIIRFDATFDHLTTLVKRTPNLKCLNISACNNESIIDAGQWEHLITSSLLRLIIFKFKFISNYEDDIPDKFKQFQSDFWHQQHHWYTEYSFDEHSAHIYTIPYKYNTYTLTPHTKRYQNQLMKHINTFDSVSELILYREAILFQKSYYFSNVTSLTLKSQSDSKNVDNDFLKTEHIDSLKTILNLSNVNHLTVEATCKIESSSVLTQLLKEASQLSSINIEFRRLQSFLHDDELRKYLNQRIRKLDMHRYSHGIHWRDSFDNSDELEEFCQIFSNLEQLGCSLRQTDDLLFLLNHLPKLSILKMDLLIPIDHRHFTLWLKDEGEKLQLTIYMEFNHEYNNIARIWIDRNIKT
jgi:hypothetical protein